MRQGVEVGEQVDDGIRCDWTGRLPVLADATDSWYAYHYPDLCELFAPLLLKTFPSWAVWGANRFAFVRGYLFFLTARNYSFVLTTTETASGKVYLFLEALVGAPRKRLIFLEFIQQPKPNSVRMFKRVIYYVWLNWIVKRVLRKSLLIAHVLTEGERFEYAELFEISTERFVFIPWPMRLRDDRWVEAASPMPSEQYVVSSGREACDWETVFKAAEGQAWRLRIICSRRDLTRVRRLNVNGSADVLCEIPREEHGRQVQGAAVYVLSLLERERSSGQVRISDVTRAGTAIVATAVRGIEGYIEHGETGLLVPPGNAPLLRAAINQLLADAPYRRRLARNAFDRAATHTREDYLAKVELLVRRAVRRD
jgi:hypothetical protein